MADDGTRWRTLDRDLSRISHVEYATFAVARPLVALGLGLAFMMLAGVVALVAAGQSPDMLMVAAAAVFGAYMALNIGANDVANNMGPAVGARVLTMGSAIALAAVCESAGALLAGGDVVETIAQDIVAPEDLADPRVFVWAMMSALVSAALWVNLATWTGAPVSTTHSIVGGVLGAGLAAAGAGTVNWPTLGAIAAGWVVAPLLGGVIAAAVLALIKDRILYRDDRIAAARVWVPILVGLMAGAFATYLAIKGLSRVAEVGLGPALLIGVAVGAVVHGLARPAVRRRAQGMENRNRALKDLFTLPLILSAALLSFAHGANDVANAVGPLAAIVQASSGGGAAPTAVIPLWVMAIGALGISAGLVLFGLRLIRMVGRRITRLNPMRAYCVALSTAVTVILASWLGLPVSSTHIAVGAVFGVGFFREWYMEQRRRNRPAARIAPEERRRRRLVRRSHLLTIVSAWVITVPAAGSVAAVLFLALRALVG